MNGVDSDELNNTTSLGKRFRLNMSNIHCGEHACVDMANVHITQDKTILQLHQQTVYYLTAGVSPTT